MTSAEPAATRPSPSPLASTDMAEAGGLALPVVLAEDFSVVSGANEGEALSFAVELQLGDSYALRKGARSLQLSLFQEACGALRGSMGAQLRLDSAIDLMSEAGETVEALVLVEVDAVGGVLQVYLVPLQRLRMKTSYALIRIDRKSAQARLSQIGSPAFARGTRITMADGEQRPIEQLEIGDAVLTRRGGVQRLRWMGQDIRRATGVNAPIRLAPGALHNTGVLLVSPDHRLFIYQRKDLLSLGQTDAAVKARQLVNGTTVRRLEGGFVEYFQLGFDSHQIIFAEGIAAEATFPFDRLTATKAKALGPSAESHTVAAVAFPAGSDPVTLLRSASNGSAPPTC